MAESFKPDVLQQFLAQYYYFRHHWSVMISPQIVMVEMAQVSDGSEFREFYCLYSR